MLKLLDPTPSCPGTIYIDELPLHKIDRNILRERIIAIPQEPVFLPDGTSVRENIDPSDESTETEGQSVLELVGLWPLLDQRGGLTTGLFPHALSQGQKQLFSLARAVLRHRTRIQKITKGLGPAAENDIGGVLLLDEMSSSVDQKTECSMQQIMMEEFKNYTVVMVSHRLELVLEAFDTVVVMDRGIIVESGVPRRLVAVAGSRFRELWLAGSKR